MLTALEFSVPDGRVLALIATRMRLAAITARFVYLVRTDDDGLQWLEAYDR